MGRMGPMGRMNSGDGFLPKHGNYAALLSFQKAEIVYDITFRFAHKFLPKGDRTIDQMIQAARSGKQDIPGGEQSLDYFKGNRDQTDQRREGKPGGTAGRLPGFSPGERLAYLGQGLKGSPIRPPACPKEKTNVRGLPRFRRNPPRSSRGQYLHLPDPPGKFPSGRAAPPP